MVQGLGLRAHGLKFRVEGLRFGVNGLGLKGCVPGLQVLGSWLGV